MRIGDREIGAGLPPYVIAEIGVNHDGDVDRAISMIREAARIQADAVKFQYFDADLLMSRAGRLARYQKSQGEEDPRDMLRRLQLSLGDMSRLIDEAHASGIHAIVTVFSLEHVGAVAELSWDAFKTASPDIINHPLLLQLAATNRPVIVSTGAANPAEIAAAAEFAGDAFLHCVSAYPTPENAAQLGGIRALRSLMDHLGRSEVAVGYSDHTGLALTGGLAVAGGASILEKHLTWNTGARGPDHSASLAPGDFSEFVTFAHRAFRLMGREEILVQDVEKDVRRVSRQSLVCVRDLEINHILTREDLTVRRPGTGLSPALLPMVVGKRLSRSVTANEPLTHDDISGELQP